MVDLVLLKMSICAQGKAHLSVSQKQNKAHWVSQIITGCTAAVKAAWFRSRRGGVGGGTYCTPEWGELSSTYEELPAPVRHAEKDSFSMVKYDWPFALFFLAFHLIYLIITRVGPHKASPQPKCKLWVDVCLLSDSMDKCGEHSGLVFSRHKCLMIKFVIGCLCTPEWHSMLLEVKSKHSWKEGHFNTRANVKSSVECFST